jgi:hypothetical protein
MGFPCAWAGLGDTVLGMAAEDDVSSSGQTECASSGTIKMAPEFLTRGYVTAMAWHSSAGAAVRTNEELMVARSVTRVLDLGSSLET